MEVNEATLLKSGFSPSDLQRIKHSIDRYGGSSVEVIQELANRFTIAACVIIFCLVVFTFLVAFGPSESIFSGSIGLACGIAVAVFMQPPFLSYKAWRYLRMKRD